MFYETVMPVGFKISFWIIIALIWTLIWKGWALWTSARKDHKVWFVVMLILNTLGILPILYIFVFSKLHKEKKVVMKPVKRSVIVKKTNKRKTKKTSQNKKSTKNKSSKRKRR